MLRLRPYKSSDAPYIVSWVLDEESFYLWSAARMGEYPISAQQVDTYYKSMEDNSVFWQMTAMDEQDVPRGHFIMRFIGEERQMLRLGNIIVDPLIRGKGYGKELLQLAQDYAKHCVKAERVSLGVFANNPGARHCYEAVGLVPMQVDTEMIWIPLSGGAQQWECIYLEKEL